MNIYMIPEMKPVKVLVSNKYTGKDQVTMIFHLPKYWDALTILNYFTVKNEKEDLFYYVTDDSVYEVLKEDKVLMN